MRLSTASLDCPVPETRDALQETAQYALLLYLRCARTFEEALCHLEWVLTELQRVSTSLLQRPLPTTQLLFQAEHLALLLDRLEASSSSHTAAIAPSVLMPKFVTLIEGTLLLTQHNQTLASLWSNDEALCHGC